ncbi:unnamed protein product [Camellia sinensis]
MLGISYGELFLLLGATAALIGPKDLPIIARTAGKLAGRAIGYVQLARGQFDTIMHQTQARQNYSSTNSGFSDMHSQATAYAKLAESTAINSESVESNEVINELTDESGIMVLPVSTKSTGLLPDRKDNAEGSDIMLEAILEAEVARNHKSVMVIRRNQVVGGITYRLYVSQMFGEIAFCAITADEQVKGYGTRLMNHLKQHARDVDRLTHFLTYADNNAVDLKTMSKRVKSEQYYVTFEMFVADVKRMFGNARTYNSPETIYYKCASRNSALIAMIADESSSTMYYEGDTVTGFLLAGVGNVDLQRKTNYLIVDSKTTVKQIEDAFKEFTTREDIAIVMISQFVANMIRFLVDSYNKPVPAILEIPSKDHPYDPTHDSVLSRVKYLFSAESVASGRR